ncbi:hypothetical protein BGZ58_003952, partial [Dissophora ornata]
MPRRNDDTVSLYISGFKDTTRYFDEEDTRRVYESGKEFTLDGRRLQMEYAQGRRKSKSLKPQSNENPWTSSISLGRARLPST